MSIAIVCGTPHSLNETLQSSSEATALSAALALRYAGFDDLTVYLPETEWGAELPVELSPNASRILRTLKALEPIVSRAHEPQFVHQRSFRTGFQLSIQALGAMAEGRYNAPFLNTTRGALASELAVLAQERGITLCYGSATQVTQDQSGVTVAHTQAGAEHSQSTAHAVAVIAADPGQRLRSGTNAHQLDIYDTDYCFWHAGIPSDALPAGAFGPVITQWLGPEHFVYYHPGTNAETLHLQALTQGNLSLSEALAQWHPSLRALATHCPDSSFIPVTGNTSPDRLVHGKVGFLAAGCHALLPHLPQQEALGIEDAWVVARLLEQWEDELEGGLQEYERYRLPRARRLQSQAARLAVERCESQPLRLWQRNFSLSLSSRFLPELAMQKNDWLYGYDAVNGFE